MEEESRYACRGAAFESQRDAILVVEYGKAVSTRIAELMTFLCDDSHWHYRETTQIRREREQSR